MWQLKQRRSSSPYKPRQKQGGDSLTQCWGTYHPMKIQPKGPLVRPTYNGCECLTVGASSCSLKYPSNARNQDSQVENVIGNRRNGYRGCNASPKGSMCVYGRYLGLKVGIWEPLWALSIYHIPTWTLWVCRLGQAGFTSLGRHPRRCPSSASAEGPSK